MLTYNGKKCLFGWDRPTFHSTVVSRVQGLDPFSHEVQTFTWAVLSNVAEVEIDGQGRILIPPNLRRHAGLTKDIFFTSTMERIEIWDQACWEESFQKSVEALPSLGGIPKGGA